MKKGHNQWLAERSKLFAKYAEQMPVNANYVQVSFDPPKYGWILMHLCVNYKEKCVITLSADTDEPFERIIRWLENIITSSYGVGLTRMDCDPNLVTFHFDPILFWGDYHGHAYRDGYCGLFYVYDTDVDKIVIDTLCDLKGLVKSIYHSIVKYLMEMQQNEDFIDNWVLQQYDLESEGLEEDSPELKELALKKVRSEIIEDYLGINEK